MFHVKHFLTRNHSKTRCNGVSFRLGESGQSVEGSEAPKSQESPGIIFPGKHSLGTSDSKLWSDGGAPQLGGTRGGDDQRRRTSEEKPRLNVSRETFSLRAISRDEAHQADTSRETLVRKDYSSLRSDGGQLDRSARAAESRRLRLLIPRMISQLSGSDETLPLCRRRENHERSAPPSGERLLQTQTPRRGLNDPREQGTAAFDRPGNRATTGTWKPSRGSATDPSSTEDARATKIALRANGRLCSHEQS